MNNRMEDIGVWPIGEEEDRSTSKIERASTASDGDIEMGQRLKTQRPSHMTLFFQQIDTIKSDIEEIKDATAKIQRLTYDAVHATTTEKEHALSEMLKSTVDATNERAKRAKTILESIKEDQHMTKRKRKRSAKDKKWTASDKRVRDNLYNTLTRKFVDELRLYKAAQEAYKTALQRKIKRQVEIVKPDATDDEVNTIVTSKGGRDALYREQVLAGGISNEIKTTYASVVEKYQDVLMLEQSLAELHQMFLDFALLTEIQGEHLDQIELHVKSAADHIESGNGNLRRAIKYLKRIRKKQCLIVLTVVVVLTVVIVVVVLASL